jgi:hypothetical protein
VTRTCTRCGRTADTPEQVEETFYRKEKRGTFRAICKACDKKRATEWRRNNPEKWKVIHQRSWRKKKERADLDAPHDPA